MRTNPMLAAPAGEGVPITSPAIIQAKLDGWRGIWEDGKLYSRKGNAITNPPEVLTALRTFYPTAVLDGELAGDTFTQSASTLSTSIRVVTDNSLRFWVFDLLEWKGENLRPLPLRKRLQALTELFAYSGAPASCPIKLLPWEPCRPDPVEQAISMRDGGAEGAIVKYLNMPYMSGLRLKHGWLKIKFTKEIDATVLGANEGENSLTGSLGSLRVVSDAGVEFKIGGAMTNVQRRDFWARHLAGTLKGTRITCLVQDDHAAVKARFGRFVTEIRERVDV